MTAWGPRLIAVRTRRASIRDLFPQGQGEGADHHYEALPGLLVPGRRTARSFGRAALGAAARRLPSPAGGTLGAYASPQGVHEIDDLGRLALLRRFEHVELAHVPREQNADADLLVNAALDAG